MDLRLAAPVLAAAALLLVPSFVHAETYCVHNPDGCVGVDKPKLQDALTAANANGNSRDTIYLGVGLFNDGKSTNVAGSPVDIIGVATNKTALTANAGVTPILDIQEPTTEIRDLRVHAAQISGPTTGISLRGRARDVMVTNQGLGGPFTGITMLGDNALLRDCAIDLVYPASIQNRAVFVSSATDALISDCYLSSAVAVNAFGSTFDVRRTRINADQGVVASGGANGEVRDTAIAVPGPMDSNYTLFALAAAGNGNSKLTVNRVSAYTDDSAAYGIWSVPNSGSGNNSSAFVKGAVFHGFLVPFRESQPGGGSTSTIVMTGYSAYDFTKTGPEVPENAEDLNLSGVDPKMYLNSQVFALTFDSPLVDRGDPTVQSPGGLASIFFWDVAQGFRVRDGDGDSSPRVDIGAFEYQRRPPTAIASALIGQDEVSFFGQESTDPDYGETAQLAYMWDFDDGTSAAGANVTHAFDTGGDHEATLTVTDPAGLTDSASVTVALATDDPGGPGDPGNPGNPTDPTEPQSGPPVLSNLSLSKKRVRPPKGATIQYGLSEPADVTFRLARRVRGRKVDGKCRKQTPENRQFKRCRRWKKAGKFVRPGLGGINATAWDGTLDGKALKRGKYRMTARAKDSTGRRSNKVRTRFRIVRPRATL